MHEKLMKQYILLMAGCVFSHHANSFARW